MMMMAIKDRKTKPPRKSPMTNQLRYHPVPLFATGYFTLMTCTASTPATISNAPATDRSSAANTAWTRNLKNALPSVPSATGTGCASA